VPKQSPEADFSRQSRKKTDSVIPDYHKNDISASIFGMMREERSLKFKFES
jgi:hypothetical protein